MNQLQIFDFESKKIRSQILNNGEVAWVAKDVCSILGLENTNRALNNHPEDELTIVNDTDSQGRIVNLLAVNEAGLYRLIFKSRKEDAERFRKFVFNEVLPSIRKTGSFSYKAKDPEYSNAQEVFKSLASVAQTFGLEGNQALLAANKATKNITGIDFQSILQIELKNPIQERPFTPTELGKRIGLTAQQLNKKLFSAGLQVKKNDVWCATEKGKSYSVLMDTGKKHSNGTPVNQLKWIETVLEII